VTRKRGTCAAVARRREKGQKGLRADAKGGWRVQREGGEGAWYPADLVNGEPEASKLTSIRRTCEKAFRLVVRSDLCQLRNGSHELYEGVPLRKKSRGRRTRRTRGRGVMVVAQEELDDRDTPVDIHKLANYENFVSLLEISPSRCERFRPARARWSPEIPRNISSSAPRACQYGSGIRSVYGRQFPIERFPLYSYGALGNSTLFGRDNEIKADEIL